jgi:hypothetical protein
MTRTDPGAPIAPRPLAGTRQPLPVHGFLAGPGLRGPFRAVADTVVPGAAELAGVEWEALEAIVDGALLERPPRMRRQLAVFLRLVNLLPILRWGRTFTRLDPQRRTRLLRALERSPLLLVRRGIWGLRTLVFMGYYGRPESHAALGYGARLRGWLEHPDAPEAARRTAAAGRDPGEEGAG